MIITAHGLDSVKLQYGSTDIIINPRSKKSTYGEVKGSSNIILSSINHIDYAPDNPYGSLDDNELRILGPGAYGKDELMIRGLHAPFQFDETKYEGAVYVFELETVQVCFAGPINDTKFPEETIEALSNVEVLFVPIGGGEVLDAAKAYKFAISLEPNVIIPTHYDAKDSDPKALNNFLNEAGAPEIKPVEKLTIKKKEIKSKQAEVIALIQQT